METIAAAISTIAFVVIVVMYFIMRGLTHNFSVPFAKGIAGNIKLKQAAEAKLPSKTYHALHNVTLPAGEGTTQIDHVFVSRYGIFVVEVKNMKGWIYGKENEAQWTQKFYRQSFTFQNPLRQNYKHVKALELIPGVPAEAIYSVIAFTGEGTLKNKMPANVTNTHGCIKYIKSFKKPVLTQAQVKAVVAQIEAVRLKPSRRTDRKHVAQLKRAKRKCPRCGHKMVLRIAKGNGNKFWGCSAFPKCREMQKVG